ncbi:TPA: hypothetical protein RQK38_000512 [Vibrio vulnificus]|nr:hypothetical protein [Vibrio vulnificus]
MLKSPRNDAFTNAARITKLFLITLAEHKTGEMLNGDDLLIELDTTDARRSSFEIFHADDHLASYHVSTAYNQLGGTFLNYEVTIPMQYSDSEIIEFIKDNY